MHLAGIYCLRTALQKAVALLGRTDVAIRLASCSNHCLRRAIDHPALSSSPSTLTFPYSLPPSETLTQIAGLLDCRRPQTFLLLNEEQEFREVVQPTSRLRREFITALIPSSRLAIPSSRLASSCLQPPRLGGVRCAASLSCAAQSTSYLGHLLTESLPSYDLSAAENSIALFPTSRALLTRSGAMHSLPFHSERSRQWVFSLKSSRREFRSFPFQHHHLYSTFFTTVKTIHLPPIQWISRLRAPGALEAWRAHPFLLHNRKLQIFPFIRLLS